MFVWKSSEREGKIKVNNIANFKEKLYLKLFSHFIRNINYLISLYTTPPDTFIALNLLVFNRVNLFIDVII